MGGGGCTRRCHRRLGPRRAPLVARCCRRNRWRPGVFVPRRPLHDAPIASCGCGIYALKRMDDALDLSEQSIRSQGHLFALIIGEVSLWGTVVVALARLPARISLTRSDFGSYPMATTGPVRATMKSSGASVTTESSSPSERRRHTRSRHSCGVSKAHAMASTSSPDELRLYSPFFRLGFVTK